MTDEKTPKLDPEDIEGEENNIPESVPEEDAEHAENGNQEPGDVAEVGLKEDGDKEASELEQVSAQAAEYLDGWQRARAELANYKKRVERERREAYHRAAAEILVKQLEILDDLERALEDKPQEGKAATWAEGIDLVHRKFQSLLENHDIEQIEAAGEPFDPNYHEAISHEETDEVDEGYVIDVVKPGYRMGDRVLRPALVRVAK